MLEYEGGAMKNNKKIRVPRGDFAGERDFWWLEDGYEKDSDLDQWASLEGIDQGFYESDYF